VNGRSRSGHTAGAKALAVLTVAMLLVAERRRRHGVRSSDAGAAEEHFPAAADLAADRRFERSLVFRQVGIVLAIAALIAFRGLLS
jgi:hypothetical protein